MINNNLRMMRRTHDLHNDIIFALDRQNSDLEIRDSTVNLVIGELGLNQWK